MYQNNLFNNQSSMQLEMQVHQAFLNSPEGKQAEQIFAESKKKWWDKVNNPNIEESQNNEDVKNLEKKVDQLYNMMTTFINEINGNKESN